MLKEFEMLPLLEKFTKQNKGKQRRKSNGGLIEANTNKNYEAMIKVLHKFSLHSDFKLVVYEMNRANEREKKKVQKYWKMLYTAFTDYLYNKQSYTDNYVGQNIKLLKAFLNWLAIDKGMMIGQYFKRFYVPNETIPIIVLEPEMLKFLIYSKEFEATLSQALCKTKDLFVFGCTVGLRYSDLKSLTTHNLEAVNGRYYIVNLSKKTQTRTRVMLPDYAVEIIKKYRRKGEKRLLPYHALFQFNINVKLLAAQAGWTHEVPKIRMKRGKPVEIKRKNRRHYRFCDLISSHCMRRTAVTTLLRLGLDENLVRQISGHAPGSKEFYKYVQISQSYMDEELSKIYRKFSQKTLYLPNN